jgi:isopenicillin-N N-acyltransferase-like protein
VHHGQQARVQVRHSRTTYAWLFAKCGIDWASACAAARRYESVIEAMDPDLLLEMQGIAEGSGLQFEEILALNCRTEILPPSFLGNEGHASGAALGRNRAAGLPDWLDRHDLDPALGEGECTAMAVAPQASTQGHTWLAQNWDWMGRQRDALVILDTHDSQGTALTTLTEAGMLAKIGMNQHGFALGLNILRSLEDGSQPGAPVHLLLRHLLGSASLDEARARLRRIGAHVGFGAASNIPCADAHGEVACFEVAPAGWAELLPTQGVVVHSNHFLCDSLVPQQAPMGDLLASLPRLATARRHASAERLDRAALEAFLRDESDGHLSVCRRPDPSLAPDVAVESVAGIVMNCSTREIWIAPGVPSRCDFIRVSP